MYMWPKTTTTTTYIMTSFQILPVHYVPGCNDTRWYIAFAQFSLYSNK